MNEKMFLKVPDIMSRLQGKDFKVVKTELDREVPRRCFNLWKRRGLEPNPKGIAWVLFAGTEREYVFPLFFRCED